SAKELILPLCARRMRPVVCASSMRFLVGSRSLDGVGGRMLGSVVHVTVHAAFPRSQTTWPSAVSPRKSQGTDSQVHAVKLPAWRGIGLVGAKTSGKTG